MNLSALVKKLDHCPCGRPHTVDIERVEIGSGITEKAGDILREAGFSPRLLVVTDENEWHAAKGLYESLLAAGFEPKLFIYRNMCYARECYVREVEALTGDVDGILSVGTGSVNDICRVSAFEKEKKFAIFATAPSMDGFASDGAPIIANNFKTTWKAKQPAVILADTRVLAAAPAELKSAGFGDMIAKYLGLFEWKMVNLLLDEYYCPAVAEVTETALRRVVSLADRVRSDDEEAAGAIMEALVLSGVSMKLALSSRPASAAEHTISHYIGCYKISEGLFPEFHGKKVGVATVLINRIYRRIAERVTEIRPVAASLDWEKVSAGFTPEQRDDLYKINHPYIAKEVDPERLAACWQEIRALILDMLPTDEEMCTLMRRAGAVTEPADIHVDDALLERALRYHPYMRRRVMLTHLLPMIGLDIMDFVQ